MSNKKRKASRDEIIQLATQYNLFHVNNTPQDIYEIRDNIHKQMSKYSNMQEINDALRHPEKYGISVDPDDPEYVLIPLDKYNVFPGYEPVRGNREGFLENSVTGYRVRDNLIPEGAIPVSNLSEEEIAKLIEEQNLYKPDFQNTFQFYTYPKETQSVEQEVIEDNEDDEDYTTQDIFPSAFYDDLKYFKTQYPKQDISQFNPVVQDIDQNINQTEETPTNVESEDNEIKTIDSLINEYFPTTLNQSVYAPSIDSALNMKPELSEQTDSKIFGNKVPSRSKAKKKVYNPDEAFVNMNSLDKTMYDLNKLNRSKYRFNLSPGSENLLNYLYEQLNPWYNMQHPLTEEQFFMHPIMYSFIPQLGFYFNPISRKYVYVKN